MGALHPSKINHGYGPGGKTVRLGTGPFLFLFFLFLFCFVFLFFFWSFCLFVCLIDFLITGTGLKLVSERTAKVNKMKNKYLC